MWGFTSLFRKLASDSGFISLVIWGCGVLYLATLLLDFNGISSGSSITNFLSPSGESLFIFGASGSIPVFKFGRWWTLLSAAWLHGGILHIIFNLLWIRDIAPEVAKGYGGARLVIIYTFASVTGALLSSLAGQYLSELPGFLRGANLTVGASGAFFGLLGALVSYGQVTGNNVVKQKAVSYAVGMFLIGLIVPRVDNWGHFGGFLGGYAIANLKWLNPSEAEGKNHLIVAIACILMIFLSIIASVVHVFLFIAK